MDRPVRQRFAPRARVRGLGLTHPHPPGAAMRSNLRSLWLRDFVERRADCLLVETPILMRAEVWKAAGHVDSFCDPLVECKSCHHRVRADALPPCHPRCEVCGKSEWTGEMQFNLMMSTGLGARADQSTYLRPETAQGIFCAAKFASLAHMKMPFGMGQVGKAFRNEISPGNFLFRAREFEQMELEFFVRERHEAEKWFRYWVEVRRRAAVEQCHSFPPRPVLSLVAVALRALGRVHSHCCPRPGVAVALQQRHVRCGISLSSRLGRALGYCQPN